MIPIPILDVPATEEAGVVSALAEPARLALLMNSAQRNYTAPGMWIADARSRSWSARSNSPYVEAVGLVDRTIGRSGAFLLNYSYEWGCTAGAADDPVLGGATLLRTLDWPFDGLGKTLIVVRQATQIGPYLSVTWPGFVGVITGSAPGRFAAAINQPPLPLPGWGKAIGWLAARFRVNQSRALPPSHLLRLAFDTCRSFADAVALIRTTPICLPALFTLVGPEAGEEIVIERSETDAFEIAVPAAANHWACASAPAGRPRNRSSLDRRAAMSDIIKSGHDWSLDWAHPPILQRDTRLVMMANPCTGRLLVQGWEKTGPATELLDIR